MSTDQILLFSLLGGVFVFLIWGRWRYDLVAFVALIVALLSGIVPKAEAFSGFGHPATVIIALVLIVSKGLSNSGAIELVGKKVSEWGGSLRTHIFSMAGVAAGLSALMNNVAALALLMPVDIQAAKKAKRSPALTLMPLSFASILGGMITLIGTPPNIIIAEARQASAGESFSMFDFAPVGLVVAVIGVLYVATIGWRLIPVERKKHDAGSELSELSGYLAELHVGEGSKVIGQRVRDLDDMAEEDDVVIVGLIQHGKRLPARARWAEIVAGDVIVVEAGPDAIDKFLGSAGLEFRKQSEEPSVLGSGDVALMEVVVTENSRICDRTALSVKLQYRHGVTLLGVSRQGKQFRDRVRKLTLEAGDILLLLGPSESLSDVASWLGVIPLAERGIEVIQRRKALLATGLFAAAIFVSSMGWVYLPFAIAAVVASYVVFDIVPLRQVYDAIQWPVIVLLGCMIPIGSALESSGGTALIANGIAALGEGHSPAVVLILLMVIVMTLSDVMNNTATAVIAAPIAIDLADKLQVNADPFLMTVAVAASCAFLTPIGHKNNTLIMGPGGYRFGDYWRMGLPLEILVIAVSVPAILFFWPL